MLKSSVASAALVALVLFPDSAAANPLVWYDDQVQAIAIDTYAYAYGHDIEVDFNGDHSSVGLINQAVESADYGNSTDLYVYEIWPQTEGYFQVYGFAGRLGDAVPEEDFSVSVDTLWEGTPTKDGFRFFTPRWDVGAGNTVVYVQPVAQGSVVPVTQPMLSDTFIRFDGGPWLRLADVPDDLTPVPLAVNVAPKVLHAKSSGPVVTASIELPAPLTVDDVDLDSVLLTVSATRYDWGFPIQRANVTAKAVANGTNRTRLTAQFDRKWLTNLLLGDEEWTVYVAGWLRDGRFIRGSTVLKVKGSDLF
ncbi:MAG TPA: hypothetical protein VJV78_12145 [Polyangiales bacterium]|nr:hypothetical protein [Polyangiales bacterium]